MGNDSKRYTMVCSQCGSDQVSRDAWANWDTVEQQWVLGAVFDYAHCNKCDRETSIIQIELADATIVDFKAD
jgi:hypothetical protein